MMAPRAARLGARRKPQRQYSRRAPSSTGRARLPAGTRREWPARSEPSRIPLQTCAPEHEPASRPALTRRSLRVIGAQRLEGRRGLRRSRSLARGSRRPAAFGRVAGGARDVASGRASSSCALSHERWVAFKDPSRGAKSPRTGLVALRDAISPESPPRRPARRASVRRAGLRRFRPGMASVIGGVAHGCQRRGSQRNGASARRMSLDGYGSL